MPTVLQKFVICVKVKVLLSVIILSYGLQDSYVLSEFEVSICGLIRNGVGRCIVLNDGIIEE
jgi:hypothetical protein